MRPRFWLSKVCFYLGSWFFASSFSLSTSLPPSHNLRPINLLIPLFIISFIHFCPPSLSLRFRPDYPAWRTDCSGSTRASTPSSGPARPRTLTTSTSSASATCCSRCAPGTSSRRPSRPRATISSISSATHRFVFPWLCFVFFYLELAKLYDESLCCCPLSLALCVTTHLFADCWTLSVRDLSNPANPGQAGWPFSHGVLASLWSWKSVSFHRQMAYGLVTLWPDSTFLFFFINFPFVCSGTIHKATFLSLLRRSSTCCRWYSSHQMGAIQPSKNWSFVIYSAISI